MYTIEGKVGLITGGASGIGAVIAKEFLQSGLKGITILDINKEAGLQVVEELNKEFGSGKAIFVNADISDRKQFEDGFKKTVDTFHSLDIVVNNAAAKGEANWEKHIAVNLTGTVNGTILAMEHYLPKYKSADEAIIINISSLAGLYGYPATPIYAASKSGVIALSRSLGCDLHFNRTKVKVIAVCPGYTSTTVMEIGSEDLLGPAYFEVLKGLLKFAPVAQPATAVSKAVVEIIGKGNSGSVWIVADNKPPHEVKFHDKY
ncbi:hypothetical protein RI129_008223 [Pyrocoelia pectoralis]|uniref:15-hydroxyprostaglandin dehydrogenase [NAD(+)]-like n=1 Tax=Pyrocoelia pectoralis TaxID=417401 RepID=A0AAN7VAQ6_9COLE